MKGRQLMGKVAETVKSNSSGIIRAAIAMGMITIVLTTSVLVGGMRLGKAESNIEHVCNAILAVESTQEKQEVVIDELGRKQSFQEGMVTAKLQSLEDTVKRIELMLSEWEPE